MRSRLTPTIVLSLLAFVLTAVSIAPPEASAEDLLVSTAVSLKGALLDISKKFEAKYPGVHVVLNAASSGELAAQIENGAPVDVFVSANDKEIEDLKKHSLVAGKSIPFVFNRLVVATPQDGVPIQTMQDLKNFKRIAIGSASTVPAGRYAEQALKATDLYESLNKSHAFVFGQNARALITYVEQGNVEAAFVYYTDYIASKKVGPAFIVPKTLTSPIAYEIVRLNHSSHQKSADQFIQFVTSDSSTADLLKYHFEKSWN